MVQKCFVHNCPIGRISCKEKLPIFRVPNDERMLDIWRKVVPQKYRALLSTDRICAKHFESKYIIDKYQQSNGDFVELHRARLVPYAIPSIFPGNDQAPNKSANIIKFPFFTEQNNLKTLPRKKESDKLMEYAYAIPATFPGNDQARNKTANIVKFPYFTKQKNSETLPKKKESDELMELMLKELSAGIEVSETEYIPICFKCLLGKCSVHTINIE